MKISCVTEKFLLDLTPEQKWELVCGGGVKDSGERADIALLLGTVPKIAKERALAIGELCKSRKGRSVPSLSLGEGETSILLTARHHACESTGSYVLEGVLRELIESPLEGARILCVPFVDYDGVLDGDQGKDRLPHDHNRDYLASPLYPEVRKILEYADRHGCHYGFDFHSPWHRGGENDNVFIVRNRVEKQDRFDRFSEELQRALSVKIAFLPI